MLNKYLGIARLTLRILYYLHSTKKSTTAAQNTQNIERCGSAVYIKTEYPKIIYYVTIVKNDTTLRQWTQ